MIKKFISLIVFFSFCLGAYADDVAFLELRRPNGELVRLEPHGQFAHCAIRVDGGWLHSHPRTGVEVTQDLSAFGRVVMILSNGRKDPWIESKRWVGKSYDSDFDWDTDHSVYCSELVGKILDLKPTPMTFDSQSWKGHRVPVGKDGLSPDEIYHELLRRGFRPKNPCPSALRPRD